MISLRDEQMKLERLYAIFLIDFQHSSLLVLNAVHVT